MTPFTAVASIVNENSILISFSDTLHSALPAYIADFRHSLTTKFQGRITDFVQSYTTLLVQIDCSHTSVIEFFEALNNFLGNWQKKHPLPGAHTLTGSKIVKVPVYYANETGPELAALANTAGLSINSVIQLHSQTVYTVFAMGFAPGFAYMGEVNAKIAKARLTTPKKAVAAGSVGIAGNQTGIYPQRSPGGWNIIGRTPINLYRLDSDNNLICLLKTGDQVEFVAIDKNEYHQLNETHAVCRA